ncbi:sugar phosphate isomerase [Phycicoccus sp. Root563]|uniref:sugar phosphate isomerase/epimerase family protein n=1 Tax=Phycicoccus sp. Root563 TaxID=1736562 RepID=UPI0007032003|nr:sugar phosphate isomerase/epimerase [Phycicoccus sp. Root563]KQZ88388.1 sugar phosphate isomerase [Phycicoccus sp. Root563]
MRLGYHTITWGGVVGDATGVTSVKDLVYRVNGPMDRAIGDIAAAGYDGVEMFDGNVADYADRPDELRTLLADAGLALAGVYTGGNFIYPDILADELHRVRQAARLAAQFGAANLVVGGGARRASGTTGDDYAALGAALDQVTDIAEEHGLAACYHPHLSTIVESPDELDRLMPLTRIGFCPDTAHLTAGGGDPAELIRRYADRLRHVHLKDVDRATTQFLPLGQGDVDFHDVIAAVNESGYDGWIVVELDSYDGDPREAAATSKKYLDELLATAGGTLPSGETP